MGQLRRVGLALSWLLLAPAVVFALTDVWFNQPKGPELIIGGLAFVVLLVLVDGRRTDPPGSRPQKQ